MKTGSEMHSRAGGNLSLTPIFVTPIFEVAQQVMLNVRRRAYVTPCGNKGNETRSNDMNTR